MRRSVHLSRQSRCASDVLSEEACGSSEQPERWINSFFIFVLGLYLVEEGFGTSVSWSTITSLKYKYKEQLMILSSMPKFDETPI